MRLEPRDLQLLRLLFARQVTADEKVDFCKSLTIESEPMEFNLMLAHLCHRHGYQGVPAAIQPRIRGAARFYLFKNATLFSSFCAVGRSLNRTGIPMLLLKGAAVKAAYDATANRCLTDIDFAVPKRLLQDAVRLAEEQGYRIFNKSHHSIDMKRSDDGRIDIHHRLFKSSNSRCIEEELADGAREIEAFGVTAWVSSPENLLTQLLENEFVNLCTTNENRRRFKWIYDCGMVLASTPAFDWSRVAAIAKKYQIYDGIRSMVSILADHFPQWVSDLPLSEGSSEIGPYVATVWKWRLQRAHREALSSKGKKWRSLFLWPLQMAKEYRFLRMDGTVTNFREFFLTHCRAKNYSEAISWMVRAWKKYG